MIKGKHWVSRSGIPAIKMHLQVTRLVAFSSILPRWIQSMIKYLSMNVLTIGDLIFSSVSNTKYKQ